jgi:2-octaprenyl-6-methoxyphenol hydroxylase
VNEFRAEIAIVGGGMAGLTMAAALALAGLEVIVIDRDRPAVKTDQSFDGRTSAIAYGSRRVLDGLGLWSSLAAEAEPILDIRVSDGDSRLFLHYDHKELGEEPLGYIVENTLILRSLYAHLARLRGVEIVAPATVVGLDFTDTHAALTLDDGRRVVASLAIAADGRGSRMRQLADIRAIEWRYPQTSIVCVIEHERPHRGVAHERFLPAGPLAVLPMRGRRSSIVWTERSELVPSMMALDDAAFSSEIERRFGPSLGHLRVLGARWEYPLSLVHATRYAEQRLALLGDAAHAIHPIAGQGFNLGLRDIAVLAELIVDAWRLGLDPGRGEILARYERWRRFDSIAMIAATDGLNRLFSNSLPPVKLARDLGLAMVNGLPPLKRFFMRHAMGLVGDLPRLVKGEAL